MSENKQDRGLVLIPAYNEELRVTKVVLGALEFLPVLVVDDGSSDATALQARSAGAEVIRQKPNQGKGAALQAGFTWALNQNYDFVMTLDADGQHDPEEIPSFLSAYSASQADLIIGQRDFSSMPAVRRASNSLGACLLSWAVGQRIPDNQSGYRLISRRLMKVLEEPTEPGFEFEVEMIVRCIVNGCELEWVPIRTIYADEKSHIRPLHHAIKFFQVSWRARKTVRTARREGRLSPANP
ncbi:MAG: glycosyltransferase family 2 protein [Anaerolineaceae bacterium]